MLIIVNVLVTCLALALSVPVAVFTLEVLVALFPRRAQPLPALPPDSRLVVLIPAHNEEAVIRRTLDTLLPTVPARTRVLVVADNCSDATGPIARQLGAEVIERQDVSRRGKGFALDFGIRHLAQSPPNAVVFLDADCQVAGNTVLLLGAAAIKAQRPVQGLNLCDPDPSGGPLHLISGLAFRFKNLVRTVGLSRLAGVNHLMGTGMALPWSLVEKVKLADGNVVEDMQLGIELALAGAPAKFVPEARVDSPLPQRRAAVRTQRTRWEQGHLRTLLTQVPRLLVTGLQRRQSELIWLALDLAVPPLSFLMLLICMAMLLALAWSFGSGWLLPVALLAAELAVMASAVFAGWAVHCRKQVPLWILLAAPFYAVAKLPIYVGFLIRRQTGWIRTERDPSTTLPRSPSQA